MNEQFERPQPIFYLINLGKLSLWQRPSRATDLAMNAPMMGEIDELAVI